MSKVKEDGLRGKGPLMVKVDEEQVWGHLDLLVKTTVEQALNGLLELETKELCGAGKYVIPEGTLDTDQDQQHHGKTQPGDPQENPGGKQLPPWAVCGDAGGCQAPDVAATRWGSRRYLNMDKLQFPKPTKEDQIMTGSG